MGKRGETAGSLFTLRREIQKWRIRDGGGDNRGVERECFKALALEALPYNVTSYCLYSAQIPLPQVTW